MRVREILAGPAGRRPHGSSDTAAPQHGAQPDDQRTGGGCVAFDGQDAKLVTAKPGE